MPERVLPSASILAIIGEPIGDKLVDLSQRQHLIPRRPDRHRCQRNIRIWRLLVAVSIPRWSRHLPANSSSPLSLQNTYTPRVPPTFLIERIFFFLNLFFLPSVTFFSHFSSFPSLTLFARGHTAASSECRVLFQWRFRWLLPWLDGSHFRHWLVLATIDDEAHRRPGKRQETYSLGNI